jgi:hypothetical protein
VLGNIEWYQPNQLDSVASQKEVDSSERIASILNHSMETLLIMKNRVIKS